MAVVFHDEDKFVDTVDLRPEFCECDLVFGDGALEIDELFFVLRDFLDDTDLLQIEVVDSLNVLYTDVGDF